MSARVKVCGLTRGRDVERCAAIGVDMYGFNCWPQSPRFVSSAALPALVRGVPPEGEIMLVFVKSAPDEVAAVVASRDVAVQRVAVQLHGDEDPRDYEALGVRIVQVLRVGAPSNDVPSVRTSRVLVDVHASGYGGTGQAIDPASLDRVRPRLPSEWILAGGLDAVSVGTAIERFRPWGVDVASGVESAPGVKDHNKLGAFVAAVRAKATRQTGDGERC